MNPKHSGILDHSPSSMFTLQQQFDSGTKCRWLRGFLPSQGNGITLIQFDKKLSFLNCDVLVLVTEMICEVVDFAVGIFHMFFFPQKMWSTVEVLVFTFGSASPKNNVNHFWELGATLEFPVTVSTKQHPMANKCIYIHVLAIRTPLWFQSYWKQEVFVISWQQLF